VRKRERERDRDRDREFDGIRVGYGNNYGRLGLSKIDAVLRCVLVDFMCVVSAS
jgi:hypothetical protein